MQFDHLEFRLHAVERMFERGISVAGVRDTIQSGKVIEDYPEDTPYPSCLILGSVRGRPLHVVVARDEAFGGSQDLSGGSAHEMHHLPTR